MADIVDGGPCPGMADIVAVGSPVMDLLVNTQRLPEGEGVSRANDIFHQGGGNASSAMAAAARLGARAGMIAKVGGDAIGRFILKDFEYNGVDTSRVVVGPPGTSSSYCIALSQVELGTRVFVLRDSTAGALAPGEIDYGYIAGAKLLHLEAGGDPASLAAAKFAREHGVAVSVDAGYYSKESEAIIPLADIFIASDIYYSEMFKGSAAGYRENCEALRGMGPSVVWVTLGSRGCVGLAGGEFYEIPSFGVRVADTTGAGDVFHGAYLAAALRGFPHGECARRASAVSAIKCMFVGGRTGLPDAAMLERFLRDGALGAADAAELEKRLAFYRGSFLEA
jgi:sugar/nucleoside kinase (ribokinase family)